MKKPEQVEVPLSANERFLYAICERLEYIAELLESKEAVEVVEEVKPATRKRKATPKG